MYEMAFDKRPAEELYDLKNDPDQMRNIASEQGYEQTKQELSNRLDAYLRATKDPRMLGQDIIWDSTKYYATPDFKPRPNREAIEAFGLRKEYNYFPGSNNQHLKSINPFIQE